MTSAYGLAIIKTNTTEKMLDCINIIAALDTFLPLIKYLLHKSMSMHYYYHYIFHNELCFDIKDRLRCMRMITIKNEK